MFGISLPLSRTRPRLQHGLESTTHPWLRARPLPRPCEDATPSPSVRRPGLAWARCSRARAALSAALALTLLAAPGCSIRRYAINQVGNALAEAKTMIVNGFFDAFTKELPMEYAVELNRLLQLQMEGAVG